MKHEDIQAAIVERLDRLNGLMPELRKMESEAQSLKADIATLNVKLAVAVAEENGADLRDLVDSALCAW
ncbi:hypothetical protein Snoj_15430 [Streptomyces nojiriensis]|uniref:Uncharacterized protein n=1 Tax=Streptomyces nojiriensis TaxID=66374 RepID=A0ABQ3SHK7_9ACTN|nr:hypothetical protein [Streptomyces nojiriensis]QTI49252.1 hypothetical protein JYK04_07123 [Streptomyces nojiriensis]GGS10277.1 hypothetical protein GCM10010205_44590 [Streptomyces nojiriensis]GHI67625.1 hypothetical protein Snoj_15430 [Streptomyces nojiriensis]